MLVSCKTGVLDDQPKYFNLTKIQNMNNNDEKQYASTFIDCDTKYFIYVFRQDIS